MHRNLLPFVSYRFTGEPVACPVCASQFHHVISRFDRRLKPLRTVMCDDCGLFYSNPMPTKDELATYYQKEYRKDYQFALFTPSRKHVQKKQAEAKARYAILRSELTHDRLSLLDFGCGSGELVHEFAAHGHDAHGFEPGATYSRFAQRTNQAQIEIRNADYQNAGYRARQFDAISMLHVLEHIPNPIAALEKAREWLKDDGILYIEVPDMQGYTLKGFEHFHFAHVLGFSRDNLIHALRQSGFRVRNELNSTSIIAEKSIGKTCDADIDLKKTAEQNLREYTAPISIYAYLRYHFQRIVRRIVRGHFPAVPRGGQAPRLNKNRNVAWPF